MTMLDDLNNFIYDYVSGVTSPLGTYLDVHSNYIDHATINYLRDHNTQRDVMFKSHMSPAIEAVKQHRKERGVDLANPPSVLLT
jgi:hypothetical protein